MSKIKIYSIIVFAPVFILFTLGLYADALYEIQTGKSNSASWQFANELSEYWQRKQVLNEKPQNTRSYFAPRHVEGFFKRFKNLDKRQCKLIIAPLKSFSELPIDELQIKIAAVLWEIYLAPINMKGSDEITMYDDRTWFIPEDSLIIPSFVQSLQATLQDSSTDMKPELIEFAQTINGSSSGNRILLVDNAAKEANSAPGNNNQAGTGFISGRYSKKIKLVERKSIPSLIEGSIDGSLFYEMLGPYNKLLDAIGESYQISSLDPVFISNLLKYDRFLESFTISKLNVKTVGVIFALYVHKDENPEFVKELIEVLANQPSSYFEKSYLMENLSLNMTREISPLFLHEATIEFFHMD